MNARALRGALRSLLCLACFAPGLAQPVAEGALYIAVLVVLFVRPQGLFGEPQQVRA